MKNLESYTVNASNTTYEAVDGILFNEAQTKLISYPANKTGTSYSIPDTITEIGNGAFSDADLLTSIKYR